MVVQSFMRVVCDIICLPEKSQKKKSLFRSVAMLPTWPPNLHKGSIKL